MCSIVATCSALQRSKPKDAEELEDLGIHGVIVGRTVLWCRLYVELASVLERRVGGKLGFKWLFGVGGRPVGFVAGVTSVFEEKVDIDNVCVCIASMILL